MSVRVRVCLRASRAGGQFWRGGMERRCKYVCVWLRMHPCINDGGVWRPTAVPTRACPLLCNLQLTSSSVLSPKVILITKLTLS